LPAQPVAPTLPQEPEAEEAQAEAIREIESEPIKKEVAEAAMPAIAEQAPVSPAPEAKAPEAIKAGEYASIARVGNGVNIRSKASEASEVLRSVPAGYPLLVHERRGNWALIEDYQEKKGWVNASLLAEPDTAIIKVWKGNLRSNPSLSGRIITKFDHGTVLSVVETRGDWLQVSDSEGLSGWLHRDVVWPEGLKAVSAQEVTSRQEIPVPAQPVASPPPPEPEADEAQAEAVREIQTEPVKKEVAEVAMPAKEEQAPVSPAPETKALEAIKAGEYASIAWVGSGVNIHPEPSMSSEVVRAFPPGYPVVVLERRGNWVLVDDFKKRKGWVYAPLLTDPKTVIIKVWKGNLRSSPNITDKIIAKLDYGTVLSVVETRGNWLQVSDSEGLSGWLHRDVVWP
jgi:SH3-like domain-containing protein